MNILLLEDRGATAFYVRRWLEENGHNVLEAFNPNDAQDYWNKREQVPIHCIILDLQTPLDGLGDEQKLRAEGGTLAGWVWLHDKVLADAPEMRQRTIIYSDFVSVLRDKVNKTEYEGMRVIPKRGRGSSADEVVASIRQISKMPCLPKKEKEKEQHETNH